MYDKGTGLSMGEKKSSDGNENSMFVNSKESAEENKSWHLYLKSEW